MEASVRILNPSTLNRHLSNSFLLKTHNTTPFRFTRSSLQNPHSRFRHISLSPQNPHIINFRSNPHLSIPIRIHSSLPRSSISLPISNPLLGFFQSLSTSHTSESPLSNDNFIRVEPGLNDNFFEWNLASEGTIGREKSILGEKGPIVTVVLLGWLGAKRKHLKRYAEWYNSRGIHAIAFVSSVKDVLWFDLGRKFEERVSLLARELASWLSETERDGRERVLLFHTFSNTGWLAYGAILDNLQGRQDLFAKIRGCVVDSGGDPDLNPKVWAAGFTAALLKKRSSSALSSIEDGEETEIGGSLSKMQQKEPLLIETLLLLAFEKFFSFLFNLPDVNQRLMKVISTLSNNQPHYPQLYLYSKADKVIPYQSVELFMEEQRKMGREVWSVNFGSSPHVDHFRTFPTIYSIQLQKFLKGCLATVKQV